MTNFQTILVSIFMAFFIFAVLIFSGLIKIGGSSTATTKLQGKVTIWGTFSSSDVYKVFEVFGGANRDLSLAYTPKNPATYQKDLIEAFANGTGPDIFMITPDMIQNNESFIYKIPYASYPEKAFRDQFLDGADVYLTAEGSLALPVAVDPMVMYYNKDILSNEGIAVPPQYWNELFDLNTTLTKKKDDGTILQSMIGLGRFDNVTHAKDILATLLLQNNNRIVVRKTTGGYQTVLQDASSSQAQAPAEQVFEFFTEFSNPSLAAYSWNRALPSSLDFFTGGKLAFYLGHASELFKIQSVNPNLSFDVTPILQTKGVTTKRTYADIYAFAVNKKSADPATAIAVAGMLSAGDTAKSFAQALSLPPAVKSLLADRPTDPYLFTFFNSAIISRSWPDPDTTDSDAIFNEVILNIISNKSSVEESLSKTQSQLDIINNK